jgi:hypothetical protein
MVDFRSLNIDESIWQHTTGEETYISVTSILQNVLYESFVTMLSFMVIHDHRRKSIVANLLVHRKETKNFAIRIKILFSYECSSKARRMKWAGHGSRRGEKRNAYRLLVGKPEGRRPLGRPRRRWLDNIRMDLVEVGWG